MKIFGLFWWISIFFLIFGSTSGYSTWMFISNIALSTPIGRHLCDQMPLAPEQKQYCERYPSVMSSIQDGARLGMKECQYRFRENRWNCSIITQSQGLFAKIIQRGSREAAFVHAITSAGVTYAVTQACSRGELENCSCDKKKHGPSKNHDFVWGGCSDDIKYGMRFAEEFVDATEMDRYDAKASMNRHNNRIGRRAVRKFINRKCKCHGPTATCPTKTCWDELASFGKTGEYLKKLYNKADHVTIRQDGSIMKANPDKENDKSSKDKLVYLETSPNYCVENPDTGSLGTAGRECNNKTGEGSCNYMCCGHGYDTRRVVRVENCSCKFQWCCEVVCKQCARVVDIHTCKVELKRNSSVPRHSSSTSLIRGSLTPGSTPNKVTVVEKKKRKRKKKRRKSRRKESDAKKERKSKKNKQSVSKSRSKRNVRMNRLDDAIFTEKANFRYTEKMKSPNFDYFCTGNSNFWSNMYQEIWKTIKDFLIGFT